jgi:hypothetical protein
MRDCIGQNALVGVLKAFQANLKSLAEVDHLDTEESLLFVDKTRNLNLANIGRR